VLVPQLGTENADRAVPAMIRLLMPAGLRGLMFAALFAAMMSHISASLNSTATIFVTDIIGQIRKWAGKAQMSEKSAVRMGRLLTAALIISTAVLAQPIGDRPSIYVYMQTILSMFQGPLLAILLLGIMWPRATGYGGFAGLTLGLVCAFVLYQTPGLFFAQDPFLFVAWWSFVFAMIVTVVVSLLTKPESEEKLRGMVWSSVVRDEDAQEALQERIAQ
jgi:Na+/proline symporter